MFITCCKEWAKKWIEEEYIFAAVGMEADKKAFEKKAKEMLGWNEEVEMEIEFFYMLDDRCLVTIRKRVE